MKKKTQAQTNSAEKRAVDCVDLSLGRTKEIIRAARGDAALVTLHLRVNEPDARAEYDRGRSTRKHSTRATTQPMRLITQKELAAGAALYPYPEDVERPKTRSECGTERPCPFVSCKMHLYLDVTEVGSIKRNFPNIEVEDMPYSCALDEADNGPLNLHELGARMNMTRERVRQIENDGKAKLLRKPLARRALELIVEEPTTTDSKLAVSR